MSISADAVRELLSELYAEAERLYEGHAADQLKAQLGDGLFAIVEELSLTDHAARGVSLTLACAKAIDPEQDIRYHMDSYENGFNARSIDENATVPFLESESLPHSVQSFWLTRRLAEKPYLLGSEIVTSPRRAGPLLLEVADALHGGDSEQAKAIATGLLMGFIHQRNHSKVALSRPKLLTIGEILIILGDHFGRKYEKNAPRLPQIAIYAMYQTLVGAVDRYRDMTLDPLLPMKAADRKAGTVGDVVVSHDGVPFEGVEVKLDLAITAAMVREAIAKLKSASVHRYLILSTAGENREDSDEIDSLVESFRRSNGCEIVVNGVLASIGYALRLVEDPDEFMHHYATQVEIDSDLGYEHRIAWNEICDSRIAR